MDDCVPYDGKDAVLVMMGDFDIDDENEDGNITINGVPYCAMITDLIFEKSEEELLSMSLTKPYEKYFAIQKECYTPYFTECCLLDDYNDLTERTTFFRFCLLSIILLYSVYSYFFLLSGSVVFYTYNMPDFSGKKKKPHKTRGSTASTLIRISNRN